jgi:hypothetical protein
VLRPERLEDELGSLKTERDVEVGRNELGHATDRRTFGSRGAGEANLTWASVREWPLRTRVSYGRTANTVSFVTAPPALMVRRQHPGRGTFRMEGPTARTCEKTAG